MVDRDIHHESRRYEKELEAIKTSINFKIITEWLRQKKLRNKSQISTLARQLRYLRTFDNWLNKDFKKLTQKDIERVITNLQEGKYKRENGKKYEDRGKANNKAELKSFLGWLIKNYKLDLDISFIDTTKKHEDIEALSMDEINQLVYNASTPRLKFMIRVLADGGFRIEELLNMTFQDLVYDKELGCYMARIKISKTKPRTISLPLSTEEINNYKESLGNINPSDYVIPVLYKNVKKYLRIHGERTIKKKVYPHLLRHTSCTFYANKLNPFQMCKRYGWEFNSSMPNRYVDRNGINEKETAKIIRSDEVGELKLKVSRQEIDNKINQEKYECEIEQLKAGLKEAFITLKKNNEFFDKIKKLSIKKS